MHAHLKDTKAHFGGLFYCLPRTILRSLILSTHHNLNHPHDIKNQLLIVVFICQLDRDIAEYLYAKIGEYFKTDDDYPELVKKYLM